jgi:hypothetical protein
MTQEQEPGQPQTRFRMGSPSLWIGTAAMVAWILFGFVAPVGSGAVHLLLALGVTLLIRHIVTGPGEW